MSFQNVTAKIFGQVKTAIVAAFNGGDFQPVVLDNQARVVNYPYQIRELVSTGHVNLTRSQEASVIAGNSSAFLDLVHVSGQNNSTVGVTVNLRYGTGNANHIDILEIPAGETVIKEYLSPYPQSEVDTAITAQLEQNDASDSPVTVTAIAVQNTN